jgi:hypothetical protein
VGSELELGKLVLAVDLYMVMSVKNLTCSVQNVVCLFTRIANAKRAKSEGARSTGAMRRRSSTPMFWAAAAPKGQTPVAYAPGSRQKLSMISTVTNKGKARWMIVGT